MKGVHLSAVLLAVAGLAMDGFCQSSAWRLYGASEGLSEGTWRYVTTGGAGDLCAQINSRTIAIFDGYAWVNFSNTPPTEAFGRVTESPAGQLWMAASSGLCQYSDGEWHLEAVPQIASQRRSSPDAPIEVCPVRQNVALALLSEALLEVATDQRGIATTRILRSANATGIGRFAGLRVAVDDGLWICGERGLAKIAGPKRAMVKETLWREFICPETLGVRNLRQPRCAEDDSVICVGDAVDSSNKVIIRFDGKKWSALSAGAAAIRFAWSGPDGGLWAAGPDGLFSEREGKLVPADDFPPANIYDAVGARGMFWLATSEGLFCRTPTLWRSETTAPPGLFAAGAVELSAQNGDRWSAGPSGIVWKHDARVTTFAATDAAAPHDALALVEMPDGKIWSATPEKVWVFDGRGWMALRGGLGRINAMMRSADGSVWVASNEGLHRFTHGAWIDLGAEEGLASPVARDVREDAAGRIWAATLRGFDVYHPEADSDPPKTLIRGSSAGQRKIPEGGSVNIMFDGRDKWNLTPPGRLLLSWRLDDGDWSPFDAATSATFVDLRPGQHYFQARAMDRNGNIDPSPARLELAVVLPWYRESRSRWIAAIGAGAALFFAGLALKRHLDLARSYALVERQVAERTAELKLANQELLQSQKMTALGTLAAGIAHDFNNILSIIKGSAQIIEQNTDNPQKIRARADRIKTVVDQGSAVVQALLGFSRASDESTELCEINAVVENTIRLLGDRFLRETQVRFDRGAPLPAVRASTGLIQQILLNFIFNAAESMAENKEVIVATGETGRVAAGLALAPARAVSYVTVSVRDHGCGIEPEILPRIFEPFFTTKAMSARRGTGLGLSVAYELARKLGAGLAVESAPGRGSVFTLIMPAAPVPKAAPAELHSSA